LTVFAPASVFEDKLTEEVSVAIVCVPLRYLPAFFHVRGEPSIVSNDLVSGVKSSSVIKPTILSLELRIAEVDQNVFETCAWEVTTVFDLRSTFLKTV